MCLLVPCHLPMHSLPWRGRSPYRFKKRGAHPRKRQGKKAEGKKRKQDLAFTKNGRNAIMETDEFGV